MIPLNAFKTKSCAANFDVDTITMLSYAPLCMQVKSNNGCPLDLTALDVECDEDTSSSSSAAATPSSSGEPLPDGWCAIYRAKDMFTRHELAIEREMTVIDAETGQLKVTLQQTDALMQSPGVLLAEIAIYDDQSRLRLVDPRYLEIRPNLTYQSFGPITVPEVRMALWDFCPAANTLLDDYEFSDEQILHAIRRPLDLWNETPPDIARATPSNFAYREHWLQATAGFLLTTAAHLFRRNNLTYSAGGNSVADQDKFNQYDNVGRQAIADYKAWILHKKYELNLARGFGTLGSGYGGGCYNV